MLSGEFSSVLINDISVNRGDRIRKVVPIESIAEMAESISRLGLIHPVVLDRNLNLVAGETRLLACKTLKWESIPFQYADTLSEHDLLAIELEENIKRKDLDWKDKCDAMMKFHKLQKETKGNWNLSDTAKAIGYSPIAVSQMISVAEEVSKGNVLVSAAPKFSTARSIVARQRQREASDVITSIEGEGKSPRKKEEILTEDFNLWAPKYFGKKFNFIHMDFPYGIDHDTFEQSAGKSLGVYKDSPETYFTLIETLLSCKENLLADSAHIMFWFSMNHYKSTLDLLSSVFRVDPYPLIWFKSDNTGILPDHNRLPRRVYETAFFASYRDRKVIQPVANVFPGPTKRTVGHTSEKSEDMLKHFFRMIVDESTNMLDPTAGSGSALRAAKAMNAASVLGLELNPVFAEDARKAL